MKVIRILKMKDLFLTASNSVAVNYIAFASSSAAAATVSQKAFFEVGIRPKKVTSVSGHGTKDYWVSQSKSN